MRLLRDTRDRRVTVGSACGAATRDGAVTVRGEVVARLGPDAVW